MHNALFVEQERAQDTLDSMGDGVISTDMEGKVTYLNLVAERMTGWPRNAALGRMFTEVFHITHGDTRKSTPTPMESALRHDKTGGLHSNSVLIRRDGLEFAIKDLTAPIREENGQIIGAVTVFHGVSVNCPSL